jgi:hypothetical protein
MLERVKQMPAVVAWQLVEHFGIGVACSGGVAMKRVCRYFRLISCENKARDIKIRGRC